MQKIYLLLFLILIISCSKDRDEAEQIAKTGYPFKATVISTEVIENIDTHTYFQTDFEKGAENPSKPINLIEELGYPVDLIFRLINNTLSFQFEEGDKLQLWRKNLSINQILNKEEISLETPLKECAFSFPTPVGNQLISSCYIENNQSIISYDYSKKELKKILLGENIEGWGSNTMIITSNYLFFGYVDYNTLSEPYKIPARFINVYELNTLRKVRTVNVDNYQGFVIDGTKILMLGQSGHKLYNFSTDRVETEGERLPAGTKGQFFSATPIYNNKIAVHDYSQPIGSLPGIFDLSSKQVRYIDRDKMLNQFKDPSNTLNYKILNYEVNLKFEIAVIGYSYSSSSNVTKFGFAYINMNSEVLSNTELPYYPSTIYLEQ